MYEKLNDEQLRNMTITEVENYRKESTEKKRMDKCRGTTTGSQ